MHHRRFRFTPSWLIFGLLVVEGLLWLSERYRWFWFNEKKGWTVLIGVAVVGVAMLVMLLWFIVALVFRWRFQFSIRSLLVLTVAVAVPCSWMAVEIKKAREQREAADEITKSSGYVHYDWEFSAEGHSIDNAHPPAPEWLRNLLGVDFFGAVSHVYIWGTSVTDAKLEHVQDLTQLKKLSLEYTQATGLEYVKDLTQLKELGLGGTQVTDMALEHLKGLTQLESLKLYRTKITDAELQYLEGLTQLQELDLTGTGITDAGLPHLEGLTRLKWLHIDRTNVTDEGVKKLQQALPKCYIFH